MANLEAVLTYRHPGVVARYIKDFGGDQGAAEELFLELMRWLYLLCQGNRDRRPGGDDLDVSGDPPDRRYVAHFHTAHP